MMKATGFGTNCKAIIISLVLSYQPKKKDLLTYTTLLISGKLISHLADINEQAENMLYRLVKEMAAKENVTEQLKAEEPLLWVKLMNNIRNRAEEIVNNEIIYL